MPQLPYLRLCLLVLCSVTVCVALWRLLPAPVIAQVDIIRPKPKPTPRPTPRPAPRPTTPRREARPGQTPAPVNVNIEMVELPGGTFTMGSNDFFAEEKPPHQVTVSPFSIGRYEITQAQYRAVMGTNPSYYEGDDRPVERVSWNDAVEFCRKLSQTSGRAYRLPTEAEWEYACRAGSNTKYSFGNDDNQLAQYAWFADNSGSQTHPVGQKKANAFGLYDLHGNVWEWCSDWYSGNYYQQSPRNDPQGPSSGQYRVLRGGSWFNDDLYCRSADRSNYAPGVLSDCSGFRVVLSSRTQ